MMNNKLTYLSNSFVVLMLLAAVGWSQSNEPGGTRVNPQTVNATTIVLLKIKPDELQLPNWLKAANSVEKTSKVGRMRQLITNELDWLKQVSADGQFYMAVDVPYSLAQPIVRLMIDGQDATKAEALRERLAKYSASAPVQKGDLIVASPTHSLKDASYDLAETTLPSARLGFDQAASAVSAFPIQLLVVPPRYLSDTFDELMPELPDRLGGGPTSLLTKGVRWAAIGVDLKGPTFTAKVQSDSPAAAEALASRLPALLKNVLEQIPENHQTEITRYAKTLLQVMKTSAEGDQINVSFGGLDVSKLSAEGLMAFVDNLSMPITRLGKKKRMRSIVLGIINYESATGYLPPGESVSDEDGRSKLSWRVHILPYLEENELYSKFHLDEAWDSPHNLRLLEEMPSVFDAYANKVLAGLKPGYTTFVAPVGESTIFGQDKATRIHDIRDGTSKTVALVEVKPELAVPWTAPQDYQFDANAPGSGLAWGPDDATGVLYCDGAWHLIPKSLPDEMLRRLYQMNDGKPVQFH